MLSWYFGPSGSEDQGPKDSVTTTFKGDKYHSLAREVIQNSLDAVLDPSCPVRVVFSTFDLESTTLPGLFNLAKTVERCKEYYSYKPSWVKFCERAVGILSAPSIPCLRIADFNTKGLEYGSGQTPFYAFMQAIGVTLKKDEGAGGSFGFGKGAYYGASALRTLIVSSIYGEGEFIFQGKARLTTHKVGEEKKDFIGLFGAKGSNPVEDPHLVPSELVRSERGTDVIIVGFDDNDHTWKESLVKSVLNNFWLAIWDRNLVVEVDDILINKDTLEATIERYYAEGDSDGRVNEAATWNPYPYFKAVKYKGGPNNAYFEKPLEALGVVRMYLFLKENLPNRTVYMRGPKMTVQKKGSNRGSNYVGVLVCDDPKGNAILREMENPEHNEWRRAYYTGDDEQPHPDAIAAENEIRNFVGDCLDQLLGHTASSKQKIMGLDEYLTIPEDLIADEEGDGNDGVSGQESTRTVTDEETGVETSTKKRPAEKIVLVTKKDVEVKVATLGALDGDGATFTGGEGGDGAGGGESTGDFPGGSEESKGSSGDHSIKKTLPVRLRVIAQPQGNIVVHIVRLYSDREANAEIEFFAGVDNDAGDDDSLLILSATTPSGPIAVNKNCLPQIPLKTGVNPVSIQFDSNEKHSLRIKSYEV